MSHLMPEIKGFIFNEAFKRTYLISLIFSKLFFLSDREVIKENLS